METLKLFSIEFPGMYPVPHGLIILAPTKERALEIAKETVTHTTDISEPKELPMTEGVVFYESGDY